MRTFLGVVIDGSPVLNSKACIGRHQHDRILVRHFSESHSLTAPVLFVERTGSDPTPKCTDDSKHLRTRPQTPPGLCCHHVLVALGTVTRPRRTQHPPRP